MELTDEVLDHIAALQPRLNAFITVTADVAREAYRAVATDGPLARAFFSDLAPLRAPFITWAPAPPLVFADGLPG